MLYESTKNVDICVRYSNTLLVSLNNRIYFREHQPPSHDDGAPSCLAVSNRGCATVLSSLSFAVPGLQPQASNGVISHLTLDCHKGDHTGTDRSLVCAIYLTTVLLNSSVSFQPNPRISCIPPEDLEWTAGVSPRVYGRKDEIDP